MKPPIVAPDSPFPDPQDMPQGISISYEDTRAIDWRHNVFYVLRCRPPLLHFLFCSICVVAILLPLIILKSSSVVLFVQIAAILLITFICQIIGQLLFVLIFLIIRYPRRESKRKHTTILTSEGLFDASQNKIKNFKWRQITFMCEHKGDVHFIKNVFVGGCTVPREVFNSLEDAKVFYKIAYKLWKSNGGAWHKVINQSPAVKFKDDTSQ